MKLNISHKSLYISFTGRKTITVPLRYSDWASNNNTRVSLGGSRGRNIVIDVNLERSNTCVTVASPINRYEITATINNQFYSGCCR